MNDSITMGNGPRVHFQDDFDSDISDEDPRRLMDTTFHFSAPVVPSDVNEDDDSDESHPSPRTPKDGEEIPLSVPSPVPLQSRKSCSFQEPLHLILVLVAFPYQTLYQILY